MRASVGVVAVLVAALVAVGGAGAAKTKACGTVTINEQAWEIGRAHV